MDVSEPGGWSALLTGPARDRAVDAAIAIGDALSAARPPAGSPDAAPVLHRTLGAVLFFTALGESTRDRADTDAAVALLDDAIDRVAELDQPRIGLFDAPVGLGWVDAVVRPRLGGDGQDGETDVDLFLSTVLGQERWPWPVDLTHGLAGLGTYSLARLPHERAVQNLGRIVTHLASVAEEDDAGLAWRFVPPPDGTFEFNEHRPEGNVNLGFAHGMPGIVAFLAAADRAGVAGARDRLAPAVRGVAAPPLPPGAAAAVPRVGGPGRPAKGTRLAWCYGDPGVAVALVAAGRALGDPDVVDLARDLASGCAAQSPDSVVDATLCHGSAGLGHLFNRLGHSLGDERVLALARHWFDVTLDRHLPGLTLVDRARAKELLATDDAVAVDPGYGLLFGAAGVGLALLAAVSDEEPWWDAVLFVEPPGSWPAAVA